MKVIGKTIDMRLVELTDAEFIANLRFDPKNKFLTKVDVGAQSEWIRSYKLRELSKTEYYFVIQKKDTTPCGTVRVYDFVENSFCWGSWLLGSNAPPTAGIESAFLVYEFAFNRLGFRHCHFDVRVENIKVRAFHERLGATILTSDGEDVYYELSLAAYNAIKPRYSKYLPESVLYVD